MHTCTKSGRLGTSTTDATRLSRTTTKGIFFGWDLLNNTIMLLKTAYHQTFWQIQCLCTFWNAKSLSISWKSLLSKRFFMKETILAEAHVTFNTKVIVLFLPILNIEPKKPFPQPGHWNWGRWVGILCQTLDHHDSHHQQPIVFNINENNERTETFFPMWQGHWQWDKTNYLERTFQNFSDHFTSRPNGHPWIIFKITILETAHFSKAKRRIFCQKTSPPNTHFKMYRCKMTYEDEHSWIHGISRVSIEEPYHNMHILTKHDEDGRYGELCITITLSIQNNNKY